uniref:Glucan endo-1 3-beta-glucosidase n=1 Tax=Rhizophora mucronata TaxID=61149 RepID=A0A2P2Q564_RHIMU
MFMYLILVFPSTRPAFGWKRQKASVSALGSPLYAKYGYGLMAKGEPVAFINPNKPFIKSPSLGSKRPEDGGSDSFSTAMECTVETFILSPREAVFRAFWTFCTAGKMFVMRFLSPEVITSLPTVMRIILLDG